MTSIPGLKAPGSKHQMGPVAIKMYDKLGVILRIETTANDVSFFKHYRKVEHRGGGGEMKVAPFKKSIYSLPALCELMAAANRRYLEFVSAIEDPTVGMKNLDKISKRVEEGTRTYRDFNLFDGEDQVLFEALVRGEFMIQGVQNCLLRRVLTGISGSQISRMLKRLRLHGLIKNIHGSYRYYLTRLGKTVITAALKLKTLVVIPSLSQPTKMTA